MKKIVWVILIMVSANCFSQNATKTDEIKIKEIVNRFFESLNKQDTVLYKKTLLLEGQVWSINNTQEPRSYSMRFFRDDLTTFDPKEILEEIPFSYDIKIHDGIAMAWVPYEFRVNGKFTHCGIDIFTLTKTNDGWKIINASYTRNLKGCSELK